jgi:DNA polymerase I-like protein with 3'-5' exonuclease and polymerase domains
VHDEIIAEVPEDRAHEAAHRIAEVMVETMNLYTPDVPARAEPALMRRWYKAADPVYVDGRLVPWEPSP